jgi:hypothetical protein
VRTFGLEPGRGIGKGVSSVETVLVEGAGADPFHDAGEVAVTLGLKLDWAPIVNHFDPAALGSPDPEVDAFGDHLGPYRYSPGSAGSGTELLRHARCSMHTMCRLTVRKGLPGRGPAVLGFSPRHDGSAMDQELIAYLDTRFTTIDRRFSEMDERFSEMDVRMNGLEEAIRHTDVKVEALRGDIRLVADGVAAVDQKLDAFRGEVAKEFEDVKAQNRASYAQVERRVSRLEQRAQLG